MLFYNNERLGLLVDGHSMYGAAKSLGFEIDYRKLHELFAKKGILLRASYFTVLAEDENFSPLRPLVDWLEYNGWRIVTKAAREHQDSSGVKRHHGNITVEIAVDAMEMATYVDHIVLFSGNRDFCHLVEALQRRGRRVSVVSTIKTNAIVCADELRRLADNFIDMEEIRPSITRQSTKNTDGGGLGVRTNG